MLNYCRNAAGLIAVWALFLGILTAWPNAPQARATTYIHTGLWVADVGADGTVVYLRQIKHR
ncbi:MAG: hypothetical protein ACPGQM_05090 [Alphaproteobacteria bacterium]